MPLRWHARPFSFFGDLVLWRGRAGSRPGSRNTFLDCAKKGVPKKRFEHQLPRYFAQALRLQIPRTTTVSSATVTLREPAVPSRLSSLRIARRERARKTRGQASEASEAPKRVRQAGKRSEAAHQATREPGSAGRPVAPFGGRSEATGGPKKPGPKGPEMHFLKVPGGDKQETIAGPPVYRRVGRNLQCI